MVSLIGEVRDAGTDSVSADKHPTSWRTERARRGRAVGESPQRPLSATGCAERSRYVAERPRALRGLSSDVFVFVLTSQLKSVRQRRFPNSHEPFLPHSTAPPPHSHGRVGKTNVACLKEFPATPTVLDRPATHKPPTSPADCASRLRLRCSSLARVARARRNKKQPQRSPDNDHSQIWRSKTSDSFQ